jgi:hypothetical protein
MQRVLGHCLGRLTLLAVMAVASIPSARAGEIFIGAPLISGDISRFVNRQETGHANLSLPQVQALADWLEHHRSGWSGMVGEAPIMEPCTLEVDLRRGDGATTSIRVVAQADGGQYLRVTGPGKWAYRSFAGIFKSWAAVRRLSNQEMGVLEKLLTATRSDQGS